MASRASLIATLTDPPRADELEGLGSAVDWLEVRADLLPDLDPQWLRSHFPGRLLFTLRSRSEGGEFEGSGARRRERLSSASDDYDGVDLELERDLHDGVLQAVAGEKRVISWHGPARNVAGLTRIYKRMRTVDAAVYKLAPTARVAQDAVAPLEFLQEVARPDVVAFATGEVGAWSRYVAPYLGAPVVFGAFGAQAGAPGQPTIEKLRTDFNLPELRPFSKLAGIVGDPVSGSLSPRIHNCAFRRLGIDALYVPFCAERFGDFWIEMVEGRFFDDIGAPLYALSVTAPWKSLAVAVSGAASPLARSIDSANTLVRRGRVWEAETTDPAGVVGALEACSVQLEGASAVVVGSGGAGRAAAAGLAASRCRVTLSNRTVESGQTAATSLGVDFVPLAKLDVGGFDIVVNATSLGRSDDDPLPFEPERLHEEAAVADLVYRDGPTPLVDRARRCGLATADGLEILFQQAVSQFRLMNGGELPRAEVRELLGLREEER